VVRHLPRARAVGALAETAIEKSGGHRYAAEAAKAVTLEAVEAKEFDAFRAASASSTLRARRGLVAGQVALLGGDPGIGKSLCSPGAARHVGLAAPPLYVSGEESTDRLRCARGASRCSPARLAPLAETQLERIIATSTPRSRASRCSTPSRRCGPTRCSRHRARSPGARIAAQLTRHAKRSGTACS